MSLTSGRRPTVTRSPASSSLTGSSPPGPRTRTSAESGTSEIPSIAHRTSMDRRRSHAHTRSQGGYTGRTGGIMFGLDKTWKRLTLLGLIVAGATAGVLVGSGIVRGSAQQAKNGAWRVGFPAALGPIVAGATAGVLVGSGIVRGSAQQAKNGPWRVVSPAPFALAPGATRVWTGKEMILYGAGGG